MAERRPLVLINGDMQELPADDSLPGAGGGGGGTTLIAEVELSGLNVDVLNVPQTYKALKIVVLEARHSNSSTTHITLYLRGGGTDWVEAGALAGAASAFNNTKEISCIIDMPAYTGPYSVYTMHAVIHQTNPAVNSQYNQSASAGVSYNRAVNLHAGGVKNIRFNSGYALSGGKALVYGIS